MRSQSRSIRYKSGPSCIGLPVDLFSFHRPLKIFEALMIFKQLVKSHSILID